MRTWVILTVVATSAWGLDRQQVDGLLAQAAQSQGKKYLEARTELLRLDEKAVLLLREAAEDSKLSWQQRLVARIVVERITRGEELDAVRFHHWTSYPPYQQRWQPVVGPSGNMAPFVVPKLREAALWYYYIELTWKNTEEFGIAWGDKKYQKGDVRFSHECWPRWCRQALEGQPEEIYLWMAIADRIEKEEGFLESYDNRELFSALVRRHGCGMAIPILLQRWDEYVRKEFPDPRPDPHDRRMTHRNFFDTGDFIGTAGACGARGTLHCGTRGDIWRAATLAGGGTPAGAGEGGGAAVSVREAAAARGEAGAPARLLRSAQAAGAGAGGHTARCCYRGELSSVEKEHARPRSPSLRCHTIE